MGNPNENAAGARRPTAKVSGELVKTARVMVDAFRLASEAGDSNSILNGILYGLGLLVYHDASGVYVVEADGKHLRHSLVRGCDPSVPQLQAPFDGQGVVGQVLATGEPVAVTAAMSAEASQGRPCAQSRLVVPIVGSSRRVP